MPLRMPARFRRRRTPLHSAPAYSTFELAAAVVCVALAYVLGRGGQYPWTAAFAGLALWNLYDGASSFWWLHRSGYGPARRKFIRQARAMSRSGEMRMADDGTRITWTAERVWPLGLPHLVIIEADTREQVDAFLSGEHHVLWRLYIAGPLTSRVSTDAYTSEVTRSTEGHLSVPAARNRPPVRELIRQARVAGWLRRNAGVGTMTAAELDELNARLATAYHHHGEDV